jgi:hypothetical protein
MRKKSNTIHNLLIPKSKISKDGDIDFALVIYFTQNLKYEKYRIASISICEHDTNDYLIVAALEDIETY